MDQLQKRQSYSFQTNGELKQHRENDIIKVVNGYRIQLNQQIGDGGSAKVYTCTHNNFLNQTLACKIIQKNQIDQNLIEQEIKILVKVMQSQKTDKKYICDIIEIFRTDRNIYIISEYCEQGTLENYVKLKKPNITSVMIIFQKILNGYFELFKIRVIHRDLKLQNILMKQDEPKIIDFGFAKEIDNQMNEITTSFQKYTISYVNPQQLIEQPYTYKADIFSLGLILYLLVNNLAPKGFPNTKYDIQNWRQKLQGKNPADVLQNTYTSYIKDDIKEFIHSMLFYEEEKRIDIENLRKDLEKLMRSLLSQTVNNQQELKEMIQQENILNLNSGKEKIFFGQNNYQIQQNANANNIRTKTIQELPNFNHY